MESKEKQTQEAAKNPKQQVRIRPGDENLFEAELDKVAGGGKSVNSSKSNTSSL